MDSIILADTQSIIPMQVVPLDENPAAVYIASLESENSRRNMRRYLDQIAAIMSNNTYDALSLQWGAIRRQHTQAIRARLSGQYAARTVNGMLSALRGVLKEAWRLGQMKAEDYQRAIDFKNVKVQSLPAGRDLASGEIVALSNVCQADARPAGIRDGAIIALLYTCGLRRAELVALTMGNYARDSGKLDIIAAKGNKSRTVYVTNGAQDALHDWLSIRGQDAGALFNPINKGGKIQRKPMTAQAVYNLLIDRAKEAQVKHFTPHDFRRTFAGDMLDAGVDIATTAKIMGHANVETTGRYDRRPEAVKRNAAQKIHFPYQKRRLNLD